MKMYRYSALDYAGKKINGRMMARNEIELEQQLLGRDIQLLNAKLCIGKNAGIKLSDLQRAWLFFQLQHLIMSGLNIQHALRDLSNTKQKNLSQLFQQLLTDIEHGNTLCAAMQKMPQVFDQVAINMVFAGQTGGDFSKVFAQLGQRYQWQHEIKKRFQKMMIYPIITLSIVLLTSLFLLLFLVPQLSQFLVELKLDLPWITRLILELSKQLQDISLINLLSIMVSIIAFMFAATRLTFFKAYMNKISLRMPFFGELYKKILLLRFLKSFLILIANNQNLHETMNICSQVTSNSMMNEKLSLINQQVNHGKQVSQAFEDQKIFPEILIRMLRMGEQTGQWQHGLAKLVELYEREVDNQIDKIIQMSEPVMTLILGILLSIIMMGILSPIYKSFESFGF